MAVKWYYKMAGQEIGPFTSQQLKQLAEEKRIAPTDPVRRDSDTEWSVARNVKGLFPESEKSAIPTGVAVPVAPADPPVVTPVKVTPGKTAPSAVTVVPTGKPARPAGRSSISRKAPVDLPDPDEETASFDFGFEAPSGGTSRISTGKTGTSRTVKRPAAKKNSVPAAEDETEIEKKPLTKKEIQKRNFVIIGIATLSVVLLAAVILTIASCKGSKPEKTEGEDAAAVEKADAPGTEDAPSKEDAEEKETAETKGENDAKDAAGEDAPAAKSVIPPEWAEVGYKCPYEDGKFLTCTFGSLRVAVKKIQNAALAEIDPKSKAKNKEREYCFIKIEVENFNEDKYLDVPGWGAKGSNSVQLFDEKENRFKTQRVTVPDQADASLQIANGEKFTDILVFNPPKLETVEYLRLVLPPVQQDEPAVKLFIPKEFFAKKAEKKAAPADGEEAEADEKAADPDAKPADAADADAEAKSDAEAKPDTEAKSDTEAKPADASVSDDAPAPEPTTPAPESAAPASPPPASKSAEEELDIFNDPNLE